MCSSSQCSLFVFSHLSACKCLWVSWETNARNLCPRTSRSRTAITRLILVSTSCMCFSLSINKLSVILHSVSIHSRTASRTSPYGHLCPEGPTREVHLALKRTNTRLYLSHSVMRVDLFQKRSKFGGKRAEIGKIKREKKVLALWNIFNIINTKRRELLGME